MLERGGINGNMWIFTWQSTIDFKPTMRSKRFVEESDKCILVGIPLNKCGQN
jgi:hypothetical protein